MVDTSSLPFFIVQLGQSCGVGRLWLDSCWCDGRSVCSKYYHRAPYSRCSAPCHWSPIGCAFGSPIFEFLDLNLRNMSNQPFLNIIKAWQMIVEPEQRVPDFIKAGADIVSVHCEQSSTIHLHRTVNQVRFWISVFMFLCFAIASLSSIWSSLETLVFQFIVQKWPKERCKIGPNDQLDSAYVIICNLVVFKTKLFSLIIPNIICLEAIINRSNSEFWGQYKNICLCQCFMPEAINQPPIIFSRYWDEV